ncbi:MAG: L,D-transpeptidase family protein [Azonexus sp.]|nr:L,D-transpeptidase family protein [Azonexus sp.]
MKFSALASSRQLLLVVAPGWVSRTAQLQRFERATLDGDWRSVGEPVAVSLGKSGLAWGRGLYPQVGGVEPDKREGDGRAPAGIFAITALFGNFAPDSAFALAAKLPYRPATADLKAIDDPASAHYNQIVDQSSIARPDWASCEDMLRADQRYAVGAVVAHNAEPPEPGAGSCIFLHVWESEGAATAGCTAMSLADMTEIAGWLDGGAAPLLVQLPLVEYERLHEAWGLPGVTPSP